MNKYTTGQKLKLTHNIDVEITGESCGHYAIRYYISKSGQPTENWVGLMPVTIIDTMDVIPL